MSQAGLDWIGLDWIELNYFDLYLIAGKKEYTSLIPHSPDV